MDLRVIQVQITSLETFPVKVLKINPPTLILGNYGFHFKTLDGYFWNKIYVPIMKVHSKLHEKLSKSSHHFELESLWFSGPEIFIP